ncbi:DUF6387 family protein [Herbaspirillum sp. GCM10030257]|uniref:DUF6387 family protein n=1 Tax=Herbaspirillum sp. GCM10030257 TaxID=3273393 RepID=UPI003610421E
MRKIDRLEELPKEFDLTRYQETNKFDITDWVINLEARGLTRFMLGKGRRHMPTGFPGLEEGLKTRTTIFLEEPLRPRRDIDDEAGSNKNVNRSHVEDLKVFDYMFLGAASAEAIGRYGKFCSAFRRMEQVPSAATQEDQELLDTPVWRMEFESSVDDENTVMVNVDLDGTEEKILADFRHWLRKIQAERNINAPKKRFAKQDFSDWAEYHILAYLDLVYWAESRSLEIPQHILGTALFPNNYSVNLPERIRKVVKPLALSMVSELMTNALRSQALQERAEGK